MRGALGELWADLAALEATRAYRAIAALADHAEEAGPFLRQALPQGANSRVASRLIADLDDERFAVREQATTELAKLGFLIEATLESALAGKPSPEAAARLKQLLQRLDNKSANPAWLRMLRAIEALEHMGTPEARQALQNLRGPSDGPLLEEAKFALERLGG